MVFSKPEDSLPCSDGSRLGLGCWAIGGHGWGQVDDADSQAAIACALDEGVRLFDTADCYGLGHSEKSLSQALGSHRHDLMISTKGGVRWDSAGKVWRDNSPAYLRQALEGSLRRLQLDSIPLYFVHWPDGKTPVSEVMCELEKMRAEGLIKAVGLSNFTPSQIKEAVAIGQVDVVQVKVNLLERASFSAMQDVCAQNKIRVMAFGCLAEGLLTGKFKKGDVFRPDDHRSGSVEFQGEQWLRNLDFVAELMQVAAATNSMVANVALKAVLDLTGVDCALFGARNRDQVRQNLQSRDLDLHSVHEIISDLVAKHGLPALTWD